MKNIRVHIVHVGGVQNKGTQALITADVMIIKSTFGSNTTVSVSAVDPKLTREIFKPQIDVVLPTVDIPHDRSDVFARRMGLKRSSLRYKALLMSSLIMMPVQISLCVLSATFARIGLKPFYRSEVFEHIKESDFVVSCSDENFKEGASLLRLNIHWKVVWWSMLVSRLFDILVSKFLGKKIILFPNTVGPFQTRLGRLLAKLALDNCDCILVRDQISQRIVNSLTVRPNVVLTHDMALLFRKTKPKSGETYDMTIGVSPGVYSYILSEEEILLLVSEYSKALDRFIEKNKVRVILLPHYVSGFHLDDLQICKLILNGMKHRSQVSIMNVSEVDEFKSILDKMEMVISSKMHPAVLATAGYVPTICIAYDQKQVGYFQQLDMECCVFSIHEISRKLLEKMDYVWISRKSIRASLEEKIPLMQEHLEYAVRQALALAMQRDIGPHS